MIAILFFCWKNQFLCRAMRQAKKVEVVHRLSSWKHVTFKGSQVFKCCMRAQTSKSRSLGNSKTEFGRIMSINALAADFVSQSRKYRRVWSVKCWKPARAPQQHRTQELEGGEGAKDGSSDLWFGLRRAARFFGSQPCFFWTGMKRAREGEIGRNSQTEEQINRDGGRDIVRLKERWRSFIGQFVT